MRLNNALFLLRVTNLLDCILVCSMRSTFQCPLFSRLVPACAAVHLTFRWRMVIGACCHPYRLARRVRERSFLKMLQMDVAWYDRPENTAGSLAQQLATDCMMVKALTGERASTSASQMVTFAVSFAIAFWECWEMTLVMVGLFPLIGAAFAIQHSFVSQVRQLILLHRITLHIHLAPL